MNQTEIEEVQRIAREQAHATILQHLSLCPFGVLKIEERVRKIETNYAALLGFMLGSGLIGGGAGALLTKLIGP
jgi:hypothetical protein